MPTSLFRNSRMSPADIHKELLRYGNENIDVFKRYGVLQQIQPPSDELVQNPKKIYYRVDIERALSLKQQVESYERSGAFKRLWSRTFTDITNARFVYYFSTAFSVAKVLNNKQPLSAQQQQLINDGMLHHSSFIKLGKIYHALEANSQRTLIVRPDPRTLPFAGLFSANNMHTKQRTIFSSVLRWMGLGKFASDSHLRSNQVVPATQQPGSPNPKLVKHAEFKKYFDEYKGMLLKLSAQVEKLASTINPTLSVQDLEQLKTLQNDIKRKERKLMRFIHPDRNLGEMNTIAEINFKRLQSFVDWKNKRLEHLLQALTTSPRKLPRNEALEAMLLTIIFNSMTTKDETQHEEIKEFLITEEKNEEESRIFNLELARKREADRQAFIAEQEKSRDELVKIFAEMQDKGNADWIKLYQQLENFAKYNLAVHKRKLADGNHENETQLLAQIQDIESGIIEIQKIIEELKVPSYSEVRQWLDKPLPTKLKKKSTQSMAQNPHGLFNDKVAAAATTASISAGNSGSVIPETTEHTTGRTPRQ